MLARPADERTGSGPLPPGASVRVRQEEASAAEVEAVFATNVFGLLNVTRAVLPHMRAARSGHVVNITSMGGFAQVAGWGVYGATKFAVEGLSEAMQAELSPLGIKVTIVEPGSFRTGFLDGSSLHATASEHPDYAATAGRVRQAAAAGNGSQVNDPAKGAAAIYAAVTAAQPPVRFQAGPDAVAMVEAKLIRVRDELEAWRPLASSTLFTTDPRTAQAPVVATIPPAAGPAFSGSSRTRRAVLDAAAALMSEGGLTATTIDAIRDRSGVSKTTIYKHWPNRLCVAVDAFAERLATDASLPDTGTALGDFREQIRRVSAFYASPVGSVFAPLLANAMQDPVASQWLQARFLDSRQRGTRELWDRAVARGEVRNDIDPDLAMDLLFAPVMWRLLSGRRPLTEEDADTIVNCVLNGLRAATA